MATKQYFEDKTTVAIYEQDRELIDELQRGDEYVPEVLGRALQTLKELEELEAEMNG